MNSKEIIAGIQTLNETEVKIAVAALNARIKYLRDLKATTFTVGQKVSFQTKRAGTVYGTVEKVNKATIIVKTGLGTTWKVGPNLLSAA